MVKIANLSGLKAAEGIEANQEPGSSSGVVAGTVLRAARLSARLTPAELGKAAGADETTIAAWEDGVQSVAEVPYPVFQQLERALTAASAEPRLISDLATAVWCDLVITAVATAQEVSCLMADPAAGEEAFAELLNWSATGQRPTRYRPYIGPGPLGRSADVGLVTGIIQRLHQTQESLRPHAA